MFGKRVITTTATRATANAPATTVVNPDCFSTGLGCADSDALRTGRFGGGWCSAASGGLLTSARRSGGGRTRGLGLETAIERLPDDSLGVAGPFETTERGRQFVHRGVDRHVERRLRRHEAEFGRRNRILQQNPQHAADLLDKRIAARPARQHQHLARVSDLHVPGLDERASHVGARIVRHDAAQVLGDRDRFVPFQADVVVDEIRNGQRRRPGPVEPRDFEPGRQLGRRGRNRSRSRRRGDWRLHLGGGFGLREGRRVFRLEHRVDIEEIVHRDDDELLARLRGRTFLVFARSRRTDLAAVAERLHISVPVRSIPHGS